MVRAGRDSLQAFATNINPFYSRVFLKNLFYMYDFILQIGKNVFFLNMGQKYSYGLHSDIFQDH